MKLVSFRQGGKSSYGVAVDGGVADLGPKLGQKYADLKAVIAAGALGEAKAAAGSTADFKLDQIEFLPTLTSPGKIICVGLNYHEHREETGRPTTANPTLFARYPDAQIGHLQPIVKPKESDALDYEGELVAVIGTGGRHVPKEKAYDILAGYSIYNDGSVRDWQRHTTQFMPGKNFVGTGGFGPWMVTPDEVGDVTQQSLTTKLNGQVMQNAKIDMMIFDIPALVAYITTFIPLNPGDIIVTGTPGGVGMARKPPVFMKAGDVCEIEITGIGTLRNPVVAA